MTTPPLIDRPPVLRHRLDFSQPTRGAGRALCRLCGQEVTAAQWADDVCPGRPA